MNKCLVTIVTVTYNAEELLEATINSAINQTYENIEYIIIDGASIDKTIDIIKKYEDKINYWISEPDEGIYFAMNKAIKKATGEWINFMNAGDTFFDLDTVEYVMNHKDNDADLIYGDHMCDGVIESVVGRKIITRSMPCCHQSLFVKTCLMQEKPFNTFYKISADYDFVLKMYKEGKKFQYIKKPFANFQGDGLSDRSVIQQKLEALTLLMNNKVELNEITNSAAYRYIQNQGIRKITEQRDNQFKQLMSLFKELSSIKFVYHPYEKFKAYKRLLQAYHEIQKRV